MTQIVSPEFVAAGIWLWDNLGKEFIKEILDKISFDASKVFKDFSQKQWERVEWESAANKYRERMYILYSTMRMLDHSLCPPML